jgi:fumarate reductase subunit D
MCLRTDFLRVLATLIATVVGFFAGLVAGGLAEALVVPLTILATGHSHPLRILDESFNSHPLGALAFVMIAGYLTAAFLGAMAAWKTARKLLAQWSPPASGSVSAFASQIWNIWRKAGRGKP